MNWKWVELEKWSFHMQNVRIIWFCYYSKEAKGGKRKKEKDTNQLGCQRQCYSLAFSYFSISYCYSSLRILVLLFIPSFSMILSFYFAFLKFFKVSNIFSKFYLSFPDHFQYFFVNFVSFHHYYYYSSVSDIYQTISSPFPTHI